MSESEFEFVTRLPGPARTKPGIRGRRMKFVRFAQELKARPGKWAKYPGKITNVHGAEMTAYIINTNRRPAFPASKFEAVAIKDVVYVRARRPRRRTTR